MTQKADIGSKRLISLAPDRWVQWVTQLPDVSAQEILASEFQWVGRESDVVIKASSPQLGEFLVLNELQLRYSARMPLRMRAYAALAEEKYNLPTYPVLVNILPPASTLTVSDHYTSEFLGLQARQDYRVLNLWQVDVNLVFEQSLTTLLPFVPILQGGGTEAEVRRAVQVLQRDEQLSELESLLAFFASFVLDTELVAQILRWDMVVLRESPWYQEILQEGERKGKQAGLAEGLQHERSLVLRLLTRRLGEVSPELQSQIEGLSIDQLEALAVALLDFADPSDLVSWLQHQ